MIEIRNKTDEELEFVQVVDTSVKGCRLAACKPTKTPFMPNDTICIMAYEPGMFYAIRPINNPDRYKYFYENQSETTK